MSELKTVLEYLSDKEKKRKYDSYKKIKLNNKLNNKLNKKKSSVSCLIMFEIINKKNN